MCARERVQVIPLRQICNRRCNRPYLEIESSEMRCKKNVSLTTDTISSNFVYAEAETGLSLKRQGRVVPLLAWLEADEWQTYHRVLTIYK